MAVDAVVIADGMKAGHTLIIHSDSEYGGCGGNF